MDFKEPGNLIVVLGTTRLELGGSLWVETQKLEGGVVPGVDPELGSRIFRAVHMAIRKGWVRSCHDLSEGGLAVALAEMAFAGNIGARASLRDVPCEDDAAIDPVLLFSESPTRFLLEVPHHRYASLSDLLGDIPHGRLGETEAAEHAALDGPRLVVLGLDGQTVIDASLAELKQSWQDPLRW